MKGTTRGRVFGGGNAGLWLFQKKVRSEGNGSYGKRQNPLVSTIVNDRNTDHIEWSHVDEVRDSVKCSPDPSSLSEQILEKADIIATSADVSSINFMGRSRKRGVFGVRKRHFESNGSDSDTSVAVLSTSSNSSSQRHRRSQTPTNASSGDSISQCHLSSASSPNQTTSSVETVSANDVSVGIGSNDTFHRTKIPSTVMADVTNLTQQSESTSVFDFDKDPATRQLGSKTSLDVAQHFFAKLDSDQTLLRIEDVRQGPEPPSTRKKSKVVHTTRGRLPFNVAKREYREYCHACQSSKIKPFSMERFLQQRSEYFRAGDVFDGMFDE